MYHYIAPFRFFPSNESSENVTLDAKENFASSFHEDALLYVTMPMHVLADFKKHYRLYVSPHVARTTGQRALNSRNEMKKSEIKHVPHDVASAPHGQMTS